MDIEKQYTPQFHLDIIKAILSVVTSLLDKNKIMYAVEGGTLLACVRHQDIIPWDDDADLLVLEKDFNKLPQILSQSLKDVSLTIGENTHPVLYQQSSPNMFKVYVQDLWATTESGRIIATPTIDIFKYRLKNDKIELYSVVDRQRFPNCYFTTKEFYPLKEYVFGSFKVKGANNAIPYLKRYYGDDCLVKGKIDVRTPNEKNALNKTRNLTIDFDIDQL